MKSQQLADCQVERLLKRVQAELHFLDKLEGRTPNADEEPKSADRNQAPSATHQQFLTKESSTPSATILGCPAPPFLNAVNTQVDGYEAVRTPKLFESSRIRAAETTLLGAGADIRHGGATAYYDKAMDFIAIPRFESFRNAIGYYSVLAHELTHWTAAAHRLDRNLSGRFASEAYAVEELIAELGAAFLCAALGLSVEPREDHADYIANWLAILRNDKKAIFTAASKAQQAANWIFMQSETVNLPEEPVAA